MKRLAMKRVYAKWREQESGNETHAVSNIASNERKKKGNAIA